jgi:hypothetical protein
MKLHTRLEKYAPEPQPIRRNRLAQLLLIDKGDIFDQKTMKRTA